MSTGTIIFIIAMGWALIIHGGLTYLIVKKKEYSLISGFLNRPKEEQEYLIQNGYIEALGRIFKITFFIFAATFLLGLLPIPYGFEIGIALFLVVLLGGLIWMQKFEVPHKRKKMYWITSGIMAVTIGLVGWLTIAGLVDNEVTVNHETFEISGMYGVEWPIKDIKSVELLEELPEVIMKSDGFATAGQLKGNFLLEEPYGNGLLFVNWKNTPYLYVTTKNNYLILNRKNSEDTKNIYESLLKVWESQK
ncbi:DUF3784 domain-containing protein [Lederbergia wuyishanensis]|uniref:Bacterial Pleckstrin homology domain-containing protein n=1 Tax=Lederbergia wuyishanensis TaxID=1347903 RepID=A0ABU0D6F1_9BACI|nr:DUF3784 domain-containing protein [Lederbergia wuyishanensis]MCJ8008596.1 DUF3784 domain-containing protein [Lederbergia wuyishanensis]MDQ0343988.1 hypothetical protein [Lederbergia wuyishanensis]